MAVERLTDYTRRIWTGLSADAPDPDMQAGDVIYYMDTSTCSIITGIPAPGSIDVEDLPDIGGGGGGELYYNEWSHAYAKSMEIPILHRDTGLNQFYIRAVNLEHVRIYEAEGATGTYSQPQNTFEGCTALKTAHIESHPKYGHNFFKKCTALEEAQLGSIGQPVTAMTSLVFDQCKQSNLVITIYVADDATLPLSGSPYGATNATIIYRSATTGEVIPV